MVIESMKAARYAVTYDRMGGIEIKRMTDGASLYLQPGDDAAAFREAIDSPWSAMDSICDDYADNFRKGV